MSPRRLISTAFRIARGPYRASQVIERLRGRQVVLDALVGRLAPTRRKPAIAVGFSYDKRRLLRRLFPETRFIFVLETIAPRDAARLLSLCPDHELWSWSYAGDGIQGHLRGLDRSWVRVEDGFLRSHGLGIRGAAPHSFCLDRKAVYFDATRPSELEDLCQRFDPDANADLVRRAENLIKFLVSSKVTKYDAGAAGGFRLPPASVLVLGQVEEDKSIVCNPDGLKTNLELVEAAISEFGRDAVFYRAHPDVAAGLRPRLSQPERIVAAANIVPAEEPISDILGSAARVCTISSLGGFEALMRGIPVSTYGGPFYAGWGLTTDRMNFVRRTRTLSIPELFACAYITYPVYFDPRSGERVEIATAIDMLLNRGAAGRQISIRESTGT